VIDLTFGRDDGIEWGPGLHSRSTDKNCKMDIIQQQLPNHNFQRFRFPIEGSDHSQKRIVDKSSAINKIRAILMHQAMMEGVPEHTKT